MKVAVCSIGRLENRYIKEFVEYYKKLGIDKIFLYDNNHDGEEHFEDVIGDYVDKGFVEITNFRNKEVCQLESYQDCYDKHKDEYDWICFFDIDEYLTFENERVTIKKFLSRKCFRDFDMIHVNWKVYGDNNLIHYEDKPLRERFKEPIMPLDFKYGYNFPENNHIKSIVRGGLEGVIWNATPHTPNGIARCCNAVGNECKSESPFNEFDFSTAWLNHYQTKTIEEWLEIKQKRGVADRTRETFLKTYKVEYFFRYNEKTEEKEKILNDYLKKYLSNKLDIIICTHKDFIPPVSNPCYKVADVRKINCKELGLELDDSFYSEILAYIYIAKRYAVKEYIGFCHYRRYFSFMDDIPNIDEIFTEVDAIFPPPIKLKESLREQYAYCHNVEDLEIVENIIKWCFKDYYDAAQYTLNECENFFTNNMFIMRKEDFFRYISFYEGVMNKYLSIIGTDIDKRIEENKGNYLKKIEGFPEDGEIWYQKRIGGFLSERLLNIFINKNFRKIRTYQMELTEQKYISEGSLISEKNDINKDCYE